MLAFLYMFFKYKYTFEFVNKTTKTTMNESMKIKITVKHAFVNTHMNKLFKYVLVF